MGKGQDLAESVVWMHIPQGLQNVDQLLNDLSATSEQGHDWKEN